jgi:hypothetical protein
VARALRGAVRRWGRHARPHMRVDFDQYVADLPKEIAAGRARLARGTGLPCTTPPHLEETTA